MSATDKLIGLLHLRTREKSTDEDIYTLCFDTEACRLVVSHYHSGGQYSAGSSDVTTQPAEDYLKSSPEEAAKVRAFFEKVKGANLD